VARQYRKFDQDFQQGAVRLVFETGKPIAQVARELGINEGTLGNWCARERRGREGGNPALSESERAELGRLRQENIELRMQRDDAPMFVKRHHEVILGRPVARS
jgi:transposase